MREFIDIVSEAGAGPSRIMRHIRSGEPFIMVSAMRSDLSHRENVKRTDALRKALANNSAVTFIPTGGEYIEDGNTEPSPEMSFFILRRSPRTNPRKFIEFGQKMMKVFNQDAIIVGDGTSIDLIERDGSRFTIGDATTFRPEIIRTLPGFSSIKGRKFSVTSTDDVPTAVPYGIDKDAVAKKA